MASKDLKQLDIWVTRGSPSDWTVDTKGSLLSYSSIQEAIDAALPGSTVLIPPGIYNEQAIIGKPITLTGPEPDQGEVIIDAAGLATVPTVWIQASNVTVRRLTIRNGPGRGIQVGSSEHLNLTDVTIEYNTITGHDKAGILTAHSAAMCIKNNIITDNGKVPSFERAGVLLYPHGPCQVKNNIIRNNVSDGIFARASNTGLVIEGNVIEQHNFGGGITLAWDERNVTICRNTIRACGAGTNDEQGGIVILQSSAELIKGNVIEDCNRYGIMWGWVPTTGSRPDEILIKDNIIKNCLQDGMFLFSQGPGGWIPPDIFPLEPIVTENRLLNNGRAGIYVSNAYYYSPGNARPDIFCNSFSGNVWGVYNATAQQVNAVNNWWGSSSGPFHPTLNPDGSGDPVSDRVDFIPWKKMLPPTGVDCLEVKRVLGWCSGEVVLSHNINIPVQAGEACDGLDITQVEQIGCQVIDRDCSVVHVKVNESEPCLVVTLRLTVKIEISLKDLNDQTLCKFTKSLSQLTNMILSVVDLDWQSSDWRSLVSCSVMNDSCRIELLGDTDAPLLSCNVSLCLYLQAAAVAKLCVPFYDLNDV